MKNLLLLFLIITVFFGCKEDREEERLMKMKVALSNDWQVHSIKVTDPAKFRSTSTLNECGYYKNWSFKDTGYFSFIEDAKCNPYNYLHAGSWKIEGGKYLKVDWKEVTHDTPGGEMRFTIEEVSADSLKLTEEHLIWDDELRTTHRGLRKWTFIRK
ncbi:lipocalin family protein [Rufibacter hautae]|uniref:Lipocalin-like domain-containing protein n=1 Tax=Rufibacter hautae TaxID=2595005 RepID=A0A5B6T6N3_9BACT|nr:lipocalin family protein [Rufibacter hautae]KAA3435928.1 hypothetical protein FOA19_23070 [Rufibacter hautae]